jgi:hypothetical protein
MIDNSESKTTSLVKKYLPIKFDFMYSFHTVIIKHVKDTKYLETCYTFSVCAVPIFITCL